MWFLIILADSVVKEDISPIPFICILLSNTLPGQYNMQHKHSKQNSLIKVNIFKSSDI